MSFADDNIIKVVGNSLSFAGKTYRCAVGKNGFSADKKEGDGCAPLGIFPLRELWYRVDKMAKPQTKLPIKIITQNDGWCDDINSDAYNKHIVIPNEVRDLCKDASLSLSMTNTIPRHEKLWRGDDVYDLIIPLGYNDSPIIKGKGSAIFIHIAKPDYSGTEGCIALAKMDLLEILPLLSPQTCIEIKQK